MTTANSYFAAAFSDIQNNDPDVKEVSVGLDEACPYGYGSALGLALSRNTTISHLTLNLKKTLPKQDDGEPTRSENIVKAHMASILQFLSQSATLRKVSLCHKDMKYSKISPFLLCICAIDNNPNIEELDTTSVSQTGLLFYFLPSREFLSFHQTGLHVKSIILDPRLFSCAHDVDTEKVRKLIVDSKFESLTLMYSNKQQFWFSSILQMLQGHPTLRCLMVSKICGDGKNALDMVSSFLNAMPTLERLVLAHFCFYDGYFQCHLADALLASPSLTTLKFMECEFHNSRSELLSFMQCQKSKTNPIRRLFGTCGMMSSDSNCQLADMLLLTVLPQQQVNEPSNAIAMIQHLELDMKQDLVGDFFMYMSMNASRTFLPSLTLYNVKTSGWSAIMEGIPYWIHIQALHLSVMDGTSCAKPQDLVQAIQKNGSLYKVAVTVDTVYEERTNDQFLNPMELVKIQCYCLRNKTTLALLAPDEVVEHQIIIPSLLYVLRQVPATRLWRTIQALRLIGEALVAVSNSGKVAAAVQSDFDMD